MAYTVTIRKNETGEVRSRAYPDWEWDYGQEYYWTDGNFGCDCNRHLEFERAGGGDPDLGEAGCGRGRYSVLYADLPDGTRVTIDEPAVVTPPAAGPAAAPSS